MTTVQLRLLYAEDEPFLGKTLQRMFSDAGFHVTLALDGEAALKMLREENYSMVLLDLLLPKVDGFEVLRQLKMSDATKSIPVIVLSNLGSADDIKKSKDLGANNHFVKVSMDPRKIVAYVKAFLEGPKAVS